MSSDAHDKRVRDLLRLCLEAPADRREQILRTEAGGDERLVSAVRRLLALDDDDPTDMFSDTVIATGRSELAALLAEAEAEAEGSADAAPERIGGYRIVRLIGSGGMGTVYEAEQESPHRRVALKVIRPGMAGPHVLQRFRREAQVLGQLQHPGIAQIFEAGIAPPEHGGQPFFAMELIDGVSLVQFVRDHGLDRRQVLELFARVCDALHHAHTRGVIHRDLKPANILVVGQPETTPRTGTTGGFGAVAAQPKVLDFGIARVTGSDEQAVTVQTEAGQILGTLEYMSPEQVSGNPGAIDARSDIYALGVLLFELLTGQMPRDLAGRPLAEAARLIVETDARRAGTVDAALRGDLDLIVATALETDPARRYASAADLAADVRRYLGAEPIQARPASALYSMRKFARRNTGLVSGLATAFLVLLLGIAGTTFGLFAALRANEELTATNQRLAQANVDLEAVSAFQSDQLTQLDVPRMGIHLREGLLAAMPEDRRPALETALRGINFVDVALGVLDRDFFGRAEAAIEAQFADQPALQARLLQDLAVTLREVGLLQAARGPQDRAIELRRRVLGDAAPDALASLHESGILALELGEYEQAEARLGQVAEARRRAFDGVVPAELSVANTLAGVLHRQGRHEEAARLARQSLAEARAQLGPEHAETLISLGVLADVLNGQGQYEEAEALFREAVERRRAQLGPDDPLTIKAVSNLSTVLENRGRYEESASLARETYEARVRVLGSDHPDTLGSQLELGLRLARQGQLREAEPLIRESLDRRRDLLGDDHYDTLNAAEGLAATLEELGRFRESEALHRDVLGRRRRTLGDAHPATLRALGNLGYVINQQGRSDEVEPIYRETLAGLRRVYGDEHPHTLTSIGNLATLLSGLGRHAEAEPLYLESLEGRRRTLGDDHPATLNAIYSMGDMLRRTGKLAEAEPYCRQALDGYRRVGGDDHIGTLYSLTSLGHLLLDRGRPAEAEPLFREAVERRRRINGDDHPQTSVALEGLTRALEQQDK